MSDGPPRIAPLAPPFDAATGALLQKMTPPGAPEVLALFRVLARHPVMAERVLGAGGFFLGRRATLALHDRELVILRVCALCRADYEWSVHVAAFARDAGLSGAMLAALADTASVGAALPDRDRVLVAACDQLHREGDIDDATWAALAATWSVAQCLELLLLAGWYHAVAYVCNAARVPREAWASANGLGGRT